jgi:hypothetical protein
MLRELNGYDEQDIRRLDGSVLPAERTTALLDRVARLEEVGGSKNNRELVRQLTVGDRVALMLQLHRLTFGDKIDCIVTCPACRDEMSVGLSAGQLLQPAMGEPAVQSEVAVGDVVLRIRPVTGADVEALARSEKGVSLAEALVRSCIISSDRPLPSPLPQETIAEVSAKLEEMDPQADILLDLSCPACGHHFKAPFFIDDFILREIRTRTRELEREVHWIAFNYHWSEDDILSLPGSKRSRYVDLINTTLSGEML